MSDSVIKLRINSQEYDNKLKRAADGLTRYADECRKVGGTLEVVEKDTLDFVKAIGQMETVSRSANGKLSEMKKTYTELSMQYNQLTAAEKQSPFGKALAQSLDQLKPRILEAKEQLNDVAKDLSGSKFGQFGSVIDTIGQKMGVTGNITEMLTSKTAMLTAGIGASVAIIGKATEAWVKYNSELAKQDQITTVTTGLKGDDADKMTDMARALVDTYNVDYRQAINAANTLMSQFGTTSEDTMQLLRDGMQGMIEGDGGKLLSMIQQYAPAFRDAGVSASQLIAVIQNSEGGIFTDQNMNAIVMGIKNIRLMTNATSEALAKLGIDGEEMTRKLNDGSMSIFDALKKVAQAVEGTSSSSQAAGEVMQQVFGRQGAMAGTKLGEAIASLNLNLEETKRQTGEVGESFAELQQANERLNKAIRDCFEYDGWEQMANGIKSKLYTALADVLEITLKIKDSWVGDIGGTFLDTIRMGAINALGPLGEAYNLLRGIKGLMGGSDGGTQGELPKPTYPRNTNKGFLGDDDSGSHPGLIVKPTKPTKPTTTPRGGGGRNTTQQTGPTFQEGSIAAQIAEVAKLQKLWNEASESVRGQYLPALLDAEQKLKDMQQYAKMQKENAAGNLLPEMPTSDVLLESLLPSLDEVQGYLDDHPLKLDVKSDISKEGKKIQGSWKDAAAAVGDLGAAIQTIEDPTAKVAGIVLESIANVALGFANALTMAKEAGGPWGWIAFAAAGTAAMISTISAIHSATGYAQGGIVKGNSYSGDNIYGGPDAMVNAGELVLTKAQQSSLAQSLTGNGGNNVRVHGVLRGKDIFIAAENWSKSVGKGELVTW